MLNIIDTINGVARFGLEMVGVFVLIIGGIIKGQGLEKVLYPILGVVLIVMWSMFASPKASHSQGPFVKFIVEVLFFSVATVGAHQLYNFNFARVYAIISIVHMIIYYIIFFINPGAAT